MRTTILFGTLVLALATAGAAWADAAGRDVYDANCSACHQAGGAGIPGAFPALHDNAFVSGDADAVVRVLLNGRGGMPAFNGDLSSEEIATVINFVRTDFNHAAADVDAKRVDALRTSEASTMEREE